MRPAKAYRSRPPLTPGTITWIRTHRGSMGDIARLIGVSSTTLSHWLYGRSPLRSWRVQQVEFAVEMLKEGKIQ